VDQVVRNALVALQAVSAAPDDVVRSVIYVVTDDDAVLSRVWRRFNASELAAAFTSAPRPIPSNMARSVPSPSM
jgi:enamine deaminase RidA (YjgF/YER057c/UK114 family)